jgi:electron transport complex protein RnfE
VFDSLLDGAGMSVGFALAIICVSAIRELLGAGKIFGYALPAIAASPALAMAAPPGAFLTIGVLLAVLKRKGVL